MPASAALSKQNEAWFSKDRTAKAAADLLVQTQGIAQVFSRELGIPAGRSAEFYTGRDFFKLHLVPQHLLRFPLLRDQVA